MRDIPLPGLERLQQVCRRLGLFTRLEPPRQVPPRAGERVAGLPLDPMLAAVYSRLGGALFARDLYLLRVEDEANELEEVNEQARTDWLPDLQVILFGGKAALAYYYATVPALADAHGFQPVVRINAYEMPGVLPVASNVDLFFDTWARYLERLVATPGYEEDGFSSLVFPWDVPDLVATDARLVRLMREARFAELTGEDEDARKWAALVLEAAGSGGSR